tara:strand:+ start:705 stop:1016 length:312 start_codon:yes stop_codon:yes gene_type:complete
MKKIVINRCFGGFGLSQEALRELQKRLTRDSEIVINVLMRGCWDGEVSTRSNPQLIEVVEELGSRANDEYANLKIVEIPGDVDVVIEQYDGQEWVAEVHRTWS